MCPKCKQSNLESLPDPPATQAAVSSSPQPGQTLSQSSTVPLTDSTTTSQDSANDKPPHGPPQPEQQSLEVPVRPIPIVAPTPTRPLRSTTIIQSSEPVTERVKPHERTQDARPAVVRPEPIQPTFAATLHPSPRRPPLLLDTAICVLFVLLCALVYRRLV